MKLDLEIAAAGDAEVTGVSHKQLRSYDRGRSLLMELFERLES
jgi:hypothetical protein